MQLRSRAVLVCVLAGSLIHVPGADAGVVGKNPFKVVKPTKSRQSRPARQRTPRARVKATRSFMSRLHKPTQRNLRGIGVFHSKGLAPSESGWGTAFLVAKHKDGSALVLTNEHVVSGLGTGQVTFGSGKSAVTAKGVRVVASSVTHDYALVRIKLPRTSRLPVLKLSSKNPSGGVYSSGFDDLIPLRKAKARRQFDSTPADLERLAPLPRWDPVQSIQTGEVLFDGQRRKINIDFDGNGNPIDLKVKRVMTSLSGMAGGSGRPIMSKDSHDVVAIHSSAGTEHRKTKHIDLTTKNGALDAGVGQVVPTRKILKHLSYKMRKGEIDKRDQKLVRELTGP